MRSVIFAVAFVACTFAVPAMAQRRPPRPAETPQQEGAGTDAAARQVFENGRRAFAAGDYERALGFFREAYQLSQRPGLLYNIAQTLDRLRRDDETLATLRQYLELVPNARTRPEVEARIRVLEASIAERQRQEEARRQQEAAAHQPAQQETATATPSERGPREEHGDQTPPPPARPPLHAAIFISFLGVGLAGGAVAVWTGLETMALNDEYQAATDFESAEPLYDRGMKYQLATNILIFGSAALGAAAIVMAFFTDWDGLVGGGERATTGFRPALALGPDGAMLSGELRF